MARTTSTNYSAPSFPKADAAEDPFLREDIQQLAAAMDAHDHTTGKGLPVAGSGAEIPDGSITSAKIADGTIQTIDIGNGQVTTAKLASGAAATNVGTLGGVLTGTLPNPGLAADSVTTTQLAAGAVQSGDMAAGAAATNVGTLGGSLSGTLPNPTLSANSVGASQITDLSVGTAEIANGAVTNAKLASDTARANLLTNGGFEIWQRGNGPFTTQLAYGPDQWRHGLAGTDTLSVLKETSAVDPVSGGQASARCTFVLGTGAGNSTFQQILKPSEHGLGGRTVTFSLRVAVGTANAVRLGYFVGTSWVYGTYHSGGGGWETLSITFTAVAGQDLYVAAAFSASCTAYLDNAMLVVGSVAADYAPLHPADDLARCQRYYEIIGETANEINIAGYQGAGQQNQAYVPFKMKKSVSPSITKSGTWGVLNSGQPVAQSAGTGGFVIGYTAVGLGQTAITNNAANAYFTVEANP